MYLGDAAEAERVLQAARIVGEDEAAVEQRAEVGVERGWIAGEGFEIEGRADVERVEQPFRVGDRERGECSRVRVAREEREPFLRGELELAEHVVREIGVRRQVGHPDRPERAHDGRRAVVQRCDEPLEELDPDARASAREAVRDEQELRAADVCRGWVALADTMLEHEPPVERGEVARVDACALAHADARREAVDGRVPFEGALDDCTTGDDARRDVGVQVDVLAVASDTQQLREGEGGAGELDRHDVLVSRRCPST